MKRGMSVFVPQLRKGWREKAGPGSGILYHLGLNLIDQALQLSACRKR